MGYTLHQQVPMLVDRIRFKRQSPAENVEGSLKPSSVEGRQNSQNTRMQESNDWSDIEQVGLQIRGEDDCDGEGRTAGDSEWLGCNSNRGPRHLYGDGYTTVLATGVVSWLHVNDY